MIGAALTLVSLAATAAGTTNSFIQAGKQKKLLEQAQADAAKSMVEAKKALSVNYMENLSIPTQAYEMERDILMAASAQATEAGREGDQRGIAATAGRVQAATTDAARGVRADMSKDLYALDKLTQEENKSIAENLASLNLAEAKGAQLAARDAEEARAAAITQGFQGVASLSGQLASAAPLYEKSKGAKMFGGLMGDYEKAVKSGKLGADYLNADGTPMTQQQAIAKMGGLGPDVANLKPLEFQDYISKMPLSQIEQLFGGKGFDTSNMGGVSDINSMTGADIQAAMFQNTNRPDVRPQTNYNDVFGIQNPLVSASSFNPYPY
jgi:hypothetical protein